MRHPVNNPQAAQLVKLAVSDGVPSPTSADGRPLLVSTVTKRTTNFKLRVFCFHTATLQASPGGLHNINPVTDADYGDITTHVYDGSGTLITDPSLVSGAVKTVIDWVAHYNYEIIGGFIDIPTALLGGTTNQWFLSVIGVPDYPPQYGGSLDYISESNLEALSTPRLSSNGRAVSYMAYNAGGSPNTNKLRFIVKYPAGQSQRLQMYVEHFV